MSEQLDARGLSCPQPVILTERKIEELKSGNFEVLVDTDTAKENISRLARNKGWEIEIIPQGREYQLLLKKE
ncbi:MAG: sulfurtransferase TusA family protein [Nitrospirota bacterium]|nr:sulfurtransferase TusA family protein [Nitrospirota bacterium]MDH5767495.1 sulfurtransferase TusA family protein [Nitrospirota bacterium]